MSFDPRTPAGRPGPPVALTVAGSDPSGGAGIQADLKTFSALGVYGCAVLTALTAQSTRGVTGVHPVPPEFVTEQLRTLLDDVVVDSVKVGMLGTAAVADAVAGVLAEVPAAVVVDPVMVATSGDRLLDDDAVAAIRRLIPLAHLLTPNVPEAAVLLDGPRADDVDSMLVQAHALRAAGAQRVLLKGGHLPGADAVDVLVGPEGEQVLTAPWVDTVNTHGTGCTLSSAVAALRPQHESWPDAVRAAKSWLHGAIRAGVDLRIGGGYGPVHHLYALEDALTRPPPSRYRHPAGKGRRTALPGVSRNGSRRSSTP